LKFGCQACGGLGHAPQNLTLRCEPCGGTGSRERCFACDKLVAFEPSFARPAARALPRCVPPKTSATRSPTERSREAPPRLGRDRLRESQSIHAPRGTVSLPERQRLRASGFRRRLQGDDLVDRLRRRSHRPHALRIHLRPRRRPPPRVSRGSTSTASATTAKTRSERPRAAGGSDDPVPALRP
jgi:hypothetical protein